jgi:cofilin
MNALNAITVDDAVVDQFKSLNKTQLRYVIYQIDVNANRMTVIPDAFGETESTVHEDIATQLPAQDCRFVFFNISYLQGTGERIKTVMALWCPSDAPVKNKMIYAAAAGPLKSKLGTHAMGPLQASHASCFDYGDVVLRCRKNFN